MTLNIATCYLCKIKICIFYFVLIKVHWIENRVSPLVMCTWIPCIWRALEHFSGRATYLSSGNRKCTRLICPVTVKKHSGETVGHVAKKTSRICSLFLQHGGIVTAIVTGRRRYSLDLVQEGLKILCNLKFCGEEKLILKLKKVLKVMKHPKVMLSQ